MSWCSWTSFYKIIVLGQVKSKILIFSRKLSESCHYMIFLLKLKFVGVFCSYRNITTLATVSLTYTTNADSLLIKEIIDCDNWWVITVQMLLRSNKLARKIRCINSLNSWNNRNFSSYSLESSYHQLGKVLYMIIANVHWIFILLAKFSTEHFSSSKW